MLRCLAGCLPCVERPAAPVVERLAAPADGSDYAKDNQRRGDVSGAVPVCKSPHKVDAPVGIFYDPRMAEHRNLRDSSHPEQPLRIIRIFECLTSKGLVDRCRRCDGREASCEELEMKHSPEHVRKMLDVKNLSDSEAGRFGNTYNSVFLCQASTEAALLSAGNVLEATTQVCSGNLRSAVCVVRPPGHHAEHNCAMGFCMFGNVALAAAHARKNGLSERVLIVDWDIHHGNGTQRMFDNDSTVLYFSTHRHDEGKFYPGGAFGDYTSHGIGAGEGYSVNVPWDVRGGSLKSCPPPGDAEFVMAFEKVLVPIVQDFNPDLVLVSAGFDSALGDPLGGCCITPAGFHKLTRILMDMAGGRLVIALEGGYNLESISQSMAACTAALLGDPPPLLAEYGLQGTSDCPNRFHVKKLNEVCRHLAQFWPRLNDTLQSRDSTGSLDPPIDASKIPEFALNGSLMEMAFKLREYAVANDLRYEDLRVRQEELLFKLEEVPESSAAARKSSRKTDLQQSFYPNIPKSSRLLLTIIKVTSPEQAAFSVGCAIRDGAHGVILESTQDNEDVVGIMQLDLLAECFRDARDAFPDAWIGLGVPQLSATEVFKWVSNHCATADAILLEKFPCKAATIVFEKLGFGHLAQDKAVRLEKWHTADEQDELRAIRLARRESGWLGLVLGTIAAPCQGKIHHHQEETTEKMNQVCKTLLSHWAAVASQFCDIIVTTTQNSDTGEFVDGKLNAMVDARPLALRSDDIHACLERCVSPKIKEGLDILILDTRMGDDRKISWYGADLNMTQVLGILAGDS